MAFSNISKEQFLQKLQKYTSPSRPISSIELLHGRASALANIEKALLAKGRQVFIYGDRGVGKSSLAQTAARQYQSSDNDFILVECGDCDSFFGIIENIRRKVLKKPSETIETTHKASVSARVLSYEFTRKSKTDGPSSVVVDSLDVASELIADIGILHSQKPVVVIDEFDAIDSSDERNRFASFLKHVGDKAIDVKFIFSGIGESLDDLLESHLSSIRQLETVPLDRISWDARWEIVQEALDSLGVQIDRSLLVRIAGVSDGFPYYVHLITEKLLWHLFDDQKIRQKVRQSDYQAAINAAIEGISPQLRSGYEKATLGRDPQYHYVLWSVADAYDLNRTTGNIFSSYERITSQLDIAPLKRDAFMRRLATLRQKSSGCILDRVSDRKGWYRFSESMVRGYVRLVAESHGVELASNQADEPKMPTAVARRSTLSKSDRRDWYARK